MVARNKEHPLAASSMAVTATLLAVRRIIRAVVGERMDRVVSVYFLSSTMIRSRARAMASAKFAFAFPCASMR